MNDLSRSMPAAAGRRRPAGKPLCSVTKRMDGMVMLALLIALMLMSIALAGALDVWSLEQRREREKQLLFVGDQYRLAILRYYRAGRVLPASVDDLLDDSRFPVPVHHLRRSYPDPVTGKNDWTFMWHGDRIYGLYSSSTDPTIKRAGFRRRYEQFEGAETYSGWQFFYLPPIVRNFVSGDGSAAPSQTPAASFKPLSDTVPGFSNRGVPRAH
jgi:type II secretory pathway pseudopilin PulG